MVLLLEDELLLGLRRRRHLPRLRQRPVQQLPRDSLRLLLLVEKVLRLIGPAPAVGGVVLGRGGLGQRVLDRTHLSPDNRFTFNTEKRMLRGTND